MKVEGGVKVTKRRNVSVFEEREVEGQSIRGHSKEKKEQHLQSTQEKKS